MRLPLFSFIYVAIFASIVSATGCSKCLNQNADNIRLGCFNKCGEAFNPSSSEYHACRDQCTEFVFQDHCCTSSCSSKSKVCLNDYFHRVGLTKRDSVDEEAHYLAQLDAIRANPDLLDKRALLVGDAPYHLIRSTEDLRSLNHPDFTNTIVYDVFGHTGAGALDRRIDYGKTCCLAAGAVLQKGMAEIGLGWTSNEWTDDQRQGLVLGVFS
ncbi:hypothetical protein V6000_007602 [Aspergillus fumigatus]